MPRWTHLAPLAAAVAALAPAPADAAARRPERIALPGAARVELSLPVRVRRPGAATLVRLARNHLAVAIDPRGRVVVTRRGRRAATTGRAPRGWTTARLTVDVPTGTVTLRVGRRRALARVSGLRPERAVLIAGRARGIAVGAPRLRWSRAATPAAVAPATPAPVPSPATPRVAKPDPVPPVSLPTVGEAPRLFAATSFWNAPLPHDTPIDPGSAAYVADLQSQLSLGDPWINTSSYSTPVYTVPADQPAVPVELDTSSAPLQATWQAVPLPADARPATGTDAHLVVYQPSSDRLWEFWRMARNADGSWHARWGGTMTSVSANPGYFQAPNATWGATATSLPLLGGLMRIDELQAGHVDHALAMALPRVRTLVYRWPAQRTDGRTNDPAAIPEGMRFRLDPALDVASLHLPPMIRMMAEAAQRYGIVVHDYSANVAFYGEDPTPTGANPYTGAGGIYGGRYPNRLLETFPWSHLQALADVG